MGTDVTPGGLRFQVQSTFKQIAKRQIGALTRGDDPKDVSLGSAPKSAGAALSFCSCFEIIKLDILYAQS